MSLIVDSRVGNKLLHKITTRCTSTKSVLFQLLLVCCLSSAFTGCARFIPEFEPFGSVKGMDATRSVNGLAVHRRMWESAGAKCLFPQKLSPRLDDFDVIVLVGQSFAPPGKEARKWLEDWLAEEKGRSVIYFGRDFNAKIYYRQKTLELLEADKVAKGEIDIASAKAAEIAQRIPQIQESTFCGWFYLDTTTQRKEYNASDLKSDWSVGLDQLKGTWPVGITLREPKPEWKNQAPSWIVKKPAGGVLKPASTFGPTFEPNDSVSRSAWFNAEYEDQEEWDGAFRNLPKSHTLLASSDGRPLLFRLTSEKYRGSQIIVAANGAPFLNASVVDPLHRELGAKIIEQCLPAKRIGLLAYGSRGIYISKIAEEDTKAAGLEMLTVWPLSGITMPAALLGVVVCAALLPILGRAKRRPKRTVSDFGLHVEALGRMLFDSKDAGYAKKTIEDYFHRVRGEAPPGWLANVAPPPGVTVPTRPASPQANKGSPTTTPAEKTSTESPFGEKTVLQSQSANSAEASAADPSVTTKEQSSEIAETDVEVVSPKQDSDTEQKQ